MPTKASSAKTTRPPSEREPAPSDTWNLRLYVAGQTPRAIAARENLKKICEEHLAGCYELEVIDLYQQPTLAKGEQISAAPTLIKKLPEPLRRFIGSMADKDKILVGLDPRPKKAGKPEP